MEEIRTAKVEKHIPKKIETHFSKDRDSQYLIFRLASDVYGVNVSRVKEVIEFDRVFKIPRVPDYIRGVINLRGEVVPIIDLSSRFYSWPCELTISTGIVIIEMEHKNNSFMIGMIIDEVREVIDIKEENIESMPEFGSKIRSDFFNGIAKQGNEFLILLEIDNVLNIEELSNMSSDIEKRNISIGSKINETNSNQ